MRFVMLGTAAAMLAACTNTTAANEAAANDGMANVTLADNGAVENTAAATPAPTSGGARAALASADGKDMGTVTVSAVEADSGLTFTVDGRNLPPGVHGIHIHSVGKCEGPKFESAGPHWNPTGKQHGKDNPMGPHQGDLPNLTVSDRGTGSVTFTLAKASMASLLDADGAAFVVHAKADDYKTDPSGNSGDRIACGVFAAG